MKKLLTLLAACFIMLQLSAQTAIAKLKFEDAETAYTEGDYNTTVTKLSEAEKLFGKVNPPILYLRIMAQKKLLDKETVVYGESFNALLQQLQKNVDKYLKQYETLQNNEDKYRDVYTVSEQIEYYPKTSEFFQGMAMEKKRKL